MNDKIKDRIKNRTTGDLICMSSLTQLDTVLFIFTLSLLVDNNAYFNSNEYTERVKLFKPLWGDSICLTF